MAGASDHENFFEGTEKLLEVWFKSSSENEHHDLRIIERKDWEDLLGIVRCEILSKTSNSDMDAYVLSESSMFVTKERFILKTCGKTTLLLAIEPLLRLAKNKCGLDIVFDIFYSRKKFARPEQQHSIHRTFEDEVTHLDKIFKNGAAYTLGRINRDCWHLFTLDEEGVTLPDQTVELLMWDMCHEKMAIFTQDVSKTAAQATKDSGISDILPGAQIDDFLFEPCGYSMNGLLPEGCYITIHVTPEPHCSYVSFETNIPQKSYQTLINKVLSTFRPGKFLITVFANKASLAKDNHKMMEEKEVKGYVRNDHQLCFFKNYNLTYSFFTRPVI
ncbi:S-adenosylmethionine decarboxylase proenzyme-like [Argopecten irradians]|uniref:S-adenosylmethionine decarboxylase proenzyme-like n=1 Tax=Argopecten irradians TaxID=31199 RepID=UPI003717C31C